VRVGARSAREARARATLVRAAASGVGERDERKQQSNRKHHFRSNWQDKKKTGLFFCRVDLGFFFEQQKINSTLNFLNGIEDRRVLSSDFFTIIIIKNNK
jgi:hypothetical protein